MIFFLLCAILIGVIVLSFFLSRMRKRKRAKRYIALFMENFETMTLVSSHYGKRKKERKALEAGIYYLERSLLRDYASALSYIYDVFDNPKLNQAIYQCHDQAIQSVQNTRRMLLAPPK